MVVLLIDDYNVPNDNDTSSLDFAKYGASALILHYFGDEETEAEIRSLQEEVKSKGAQVVTIAGDIGDPATSSRVRGRFSSFSSSKIEIETITRLSMLELKHLVE